MNHRRFFFTGLAALIGVAAFLALRAGGQNPLEPRPALPDVKPGLVEEIAEFFVTTPDGKRVRVQSVQAGSADRAPTVVYSTPDGRAVYGLPAYPPGRSPALDPESQKLLEQEQALAQGVRTLASGAIGPDAEVKIRLREHLAKIFDLQQQRRTHEIAKIEERLDKLKETLKKRDAAKDSIIDRRLETLTGGVDELGWEESLPAHATPYSQPGWSLPNATPVPNNPRLAPPVPVAPRAGSIPNAVPPPDGTSYPPTAPAAPLLPPTTSAPAATTPAAEPPAALPPPAASRL